MLSATTFQGYIKTGMFAMDVWYFPKSTGTVGLGKYQTEICNNREIPSATLRTVLCNNWYFYYTRNRYKVLNVDN